MRVLANASLRREIVAELALNAKVRGATFDDALRQALRAGELALQIDLVQSENALLSKRVRFMEKNLPDLQGEIQWLLGVIAQAEKDEALMQRLLFEGEHSQSPGPRSESNER
jgi:hypothetical protein